MNIVTQGLGASQPIKGKAAYDISNQRTIITPTWNTNKLINCMKNLVLIVFLLITMNNIGFSQQDLQPKAWIGVWSYKFEYVGAYEIDSILLDSKNNVLYHLKIKAIQEVIKGKDIWYYILIATDSLDVINKDLLMQKINITDYEYKWRFEYNSSLSYLRDKKKEPTPEFLPDGHWLYFSTEANKIGVSKEKHVRNHKLEKFYKTYNLSTGLENSYFELKDGLLDGIEYFDVGGRNRIKAILRYSNGVFIECLYNRNDL